MTGNKWFPSPKPTLASIQAKIDALDAAHTAVQTRTRGLAADRNAKMAALRRALLSLLVYVQTVARQNPSKALVIIESAGFSMKKSSAKKPKKAFEVRPGKLPGTARLIAKAAGKRAVYEWQRRTPGGAWASLQATIQASSRVDDLTPGTVVDFRFRAVTKKGPGKWSQPFRYIVR